MGVWKVALVGVSILISIAYGEKEETIPVSDTAVGTECDNDITVAKTCLLCSRLHRDIAVQLTDCCSEDKAFTFCDVCTRNPEKCLQESRSIDRLGHNKDENNIDKRYGSIFMSRGMFGKRNLNQDVNDQEVDKRYGSMFMSRGMFGKRDRSDEDQDVDKRYGTMFMGSGRFGKRYGRLFVGGSGKWYGRYGKRSDESDSRDDDDDYYSDAGDDDRYKLYGGLNPEEYILDNKQDSSNEGGIDKRYGRLFMSSNGYGMYGGKRYRNHLYRRRYKQRG